MTPAPPAALRRVLFLQRPDLVEAQREVVERALARAVPGVEVVCAGEPAAIPTGASFDAVIAPTLAWLPEALARVEGVRWVHFLSAGVERIWDMDVRWDELILTRSSGVHAAAMSEFAIGAMLYFEKRLGLYHDQQRERIWRREWLGELAGKTVLLFGLGAIGQALARRARAFEMRVLGVSRSGRPLEEVDRVARAGEAGALLPEADVVVLCLPLTPETRGLVDEGFLSALKRGVLLVDLSRGGVVREEALSAALQDGRVAAAALDVFEREPLPSGSPLWSLPNVLITPHVAGTTPRYLERALAIFLANWERLASGQVPLTPVSLALGY